MKPIDQFLHSVQESFAENRSTWDRYVVPLSDEQFTRDAGYSHGSVRNQVVHLMSVDDAWFGDLRGVEVSGLPDPTSLPDRASLREHWDGVERRMRDYLARLSDDMLLAKPIAEGEDKDLVLWQVLVHVVNHGTDHRAQLLRLLNDLGVETVSQDYIFYAYDHP